MTPARITPPPKPLSALSALRVGRRNILETVPQAVYHEPIVSGRTLWRWHSAASAEAMRHVLHDRADNYPKSKIMRRVLEPGIGGSIFVADGNDWSWQRKACAPAFRPRRIEEFAIRIANRTKAKLQAELLPRTGPIDVLPFLTDAAFEVVLDFVLGAQTADEAEFKALVAEYLDRIGRINAIDFLNLPVWMRQAFDLRNRPLVRRIQAAMDRIIDERSRQSNNEGDLLDLLLEAVDPDGRPMSRKLVRSNLFAFLFAGHETSALTLTWALYLVAHAPDVQDRIRAEGAEAARGDSYAGQVIEETMRLYPPASMLVRDARHDDQICGREIRRGDYVFLPIYALHRHENAWADPDRFDPDNFSPERRNNRERFQFLPFGAGPRICQGAAFAMMQTRVMLGTILSMFRITPSENCNPHPELVITLRPRGGIQLEMTPC